MGKEKSAAKNVTLKIDGQIHERFKSIATKKEIEMSSLVEEFMDSWTHQAHMAAQRRVLMHQAVGLLNAAVVEQLSRDNKWAERALMRAGMGLPGATVFDHRIEHFSQEKQELGERFARWILRRALYFMTVGRKVLLLCDSGTTVFWFLKALGEAINDLSAEIKNHEVSLRNLRIVTNNIPGAESFVTYASHHEIAVARGKDKVKISDVVECRLLAGNLLPQYVAVTGDDTKRDLETVCGKAKKNQSRATKPVIIGITTGNWVSLNYQGGRRAPSLLARGTGHGEFKATMLKLCDEVFVIAPLGKVLLEPVEALNKALNYRKGATNPNLRSYAKVAMTSRQAKRIKLVSTTRSKESIFLRHSMKVEGAVGDFTVLPANGRDDLCSSKIEEIKSLLFPFDEFHIKDVEDQVLIELPHEATRTTEFRSKFFSMTN